MGLCEICGSSLLQTETDWARSGVLRSRYDVIGRVVA